MVDNTTPISARTSKRQSRPRKVEKWDDDFIQEPIENDAETSTPEARPILGQSSRNDHQENVPLKIVTTGRSSPTDSFISSWDDSPPRDDPARPSSIHIRSDSKGAYGGSHLALPRHSPSNTSAFPSPILTSSHTPPLPTSTLSPPINLPEPQRKTVNTVASSDTLKPAKLMKRFPSTSFVPSAFPNRSSSSLASTAQTNRSSPHLSHQTSMEQMPPPSLSFLHRRKSRGNRQERKEEDVRVSQIPFSPSSDALRDGERKSFWKRSSVIPQPSITQQDSENQAQRRRRSSSVGGSRSPTKIYGNQPPVPPVPQNLRSTSSASDASDMSRASIQSGPSRSVTFQSIRRSVSSLSRRSDKTGKPQSRLPTPILAAAPDIHPSDHLSHRQPTPTSPTGPISRGFHVPSPSLNSPYNAASPPLRSMTSLPHSHSYPGRPIRDSDTDTDTDYGNDATPRRKPRPVSALPAPRATSRGFDGNGWVGFGDSAQPSRPPSSRQSSSSSFHRPSPSEVSRPPSPRTLGFKSGTASRIRKHARKVSDSLKFGSGTASIFSAPRRDSSHLETVEGSPNKPTRSPIRPKIPQSMPDEVFQVDTRREIASGLSSASRTGTLRENGTSSAIVSRVSEDAGSAKADKARRRRSANGLKIPDFIAKSQEKVNAQQLALTEFYRGTNTLVKLRAELGVLYEQLQSSPPAVGTDVTSELVYQYDPLQQRAGAIIDWSYTGVTPGTQQDIAAHASPARSRRVTLASDKARAAADTLSALNGMSANGNREAAGRSISLPEPEGSQGPPQADVKKAWRASMGRPDSQRRQLSVWEILKEEKPTRPGMLCGSSTVSASSSQGLSPSIVDKSATPVKQPTSSVSFPSPPDSNYVIPSASFPSPHTASDLAQPQRPQLKGKRNGKSGLAALMAYLKALKNPQSETGRVEAKRPSPMHPQQSRPAASKVSPPVTPVTPVTPQMEDVPYPTAKSSSSAFRRRSITPPRHVLSPQKSRRRPKLKNLFRGSSGNWSELRNGASTSTPPLPDLSRSSTESATGAISGLPSRSVSRSTSSQYIGVAKPNRTPTNTSFNFSSSTYTPSSPGKSKSSGRSQSKFKSIANDSTIITDGKSSIRRSSTSHTLQGNRGLPKETENTLRPNVKSRLNGLGRPSSPNSPTSAQFTQSHWPSSSNPSGGEEEGSSRNVSGSTDWSLISDETTGTTNTDISGLSGIPGTSGVSGVSGLMGLPGLPGLPGNLGYMNGSDVIAFDAEGVEYLLKEQKELLVEMREWKAKIEALCGMA